MEKEMISWPDFEKIEARVGTIIAAEINASANKPAFILQVDFGEHGIKKSSAQLTDLYTAKELLQKQVIAVINFPPKQIGKMMSECLVLGLVNEEGVVLIKPDKRVKNGLKVS